jgi:hypothetical protein
MDIRRALETEHSKRMTMRIVEYVGEDARKFKDLIEIFFSDEYVLAQRAGWAVNYCAEFHPKLVRPHLKKMLDQLERDDIHDAVRRNVFRILQFVEIPEKLLGRVYAHCLDYVEKADAPIAVRVFALSVAAKIARAEPDLLRELQLVVKKHLPYAPAAIRSRARKILSAV